LSAAIGIYPDLSCRHWREHGLVAWASEWTLFDLEHLYFLKNMKTMAAGDEQDRVTGTQDVTFDVRAVRFVEVHPEETAFDKKNLERSKNLAPHFVVTVRPDGRSRRMPHVGELL
jgi:hypothetical protein